MFTLESYLKAVTVPRSLWLRLAYIVWCIGVSAFALGSFVQLVEPYLAIQYNYSTEALAVVGQVGFQWLFMIRSDWKERVRYMFIALTVSMIGSLMLWPLLLFYRLLGSSPPFAVSYFFVVIGIIFVIHHLLIGRNSLPKILSCTWVVYRCLLLLFVLVPR